MGPCPVDGFCLIGAVGRAAARTPGAESAAALAYLKGLSRRPGGPLFAGGWEEFG